MKILWVSQHTPLPSQIAELKRLFGEDTIVHQDGQPFSSAQEVANRFKYGGYDEMVLIAPLSVCRIITEMGYRPLWSEMRRSDKEDCELEVRGRREQLEGCGRHYKFVRFRRLEGIEMSFSEVCPVQTAS